MEDPILHIEHFTLDNLTTVSLNTDALKTNFEIILDFMKRFKSQLSFHNQEIKDLKDNSQKEIHDLREKINQLENQQRKDKETTDLNVDDLSNEIKHLKERAHKLEHRTDGHDSDIEQIREELKKLRHRIDNLGDSKSSGDGVDSSALSDLREQIRDIYEKLENTVTRDQLSDYATILYVDEKKAELDNRIDDLYKLLRDLQDEIYKKLEELASKKDLDELAKHLELLKNDTMRSEDIHALINELREQLKLKVDCEIYDQHVANYTTTINHIYSLLSEKNGDGEKQVIQQIAPVQNTLSTKDANLLKELEKKFPELEALVRKLQKDLSDHQISYKAFSEQATKKLDAQEIFKNEANKRITALEDALKDLKNLVESSSKSAGSNKGTGEVDPGLRQEISRILGRLAVITETIEKHGAEIQCLRDEFGPFAKYLAGLESRLGMLETRVASAENRLNGAENRIAVIEDEINELKTLRARIEILEGLIRELKEKTKPSKSNSVDMTHSMGVNLEIVKQMIDEAVNNLRNEILELIERLKELISKKADFDDIVKSETTLLEKLDQVAGALLNRCADKNDTKKALLFLEKKIKEISIIIFGDPSQGEDGAILAKKPWNPWSCVSCDNRLNKYPGGLIDHKNWNKFPPVDSSPDKMTQGKFGKGWQKYSDMRKTQYSSMGTTGYGKNFEHLPEIHGSQQYQTFDGKGDENPTK